MKIAIDGNEANVKERVGVSVYTFQLLLYFKKISSKDTEFIIFLKNKPLKSLPFENEYFKYEVVPGSILWSQTSLPFRLYQSKFLKQKIDVFFSPAHYSPRLSPFNTIVTIHDLSYYYYPNEFLKKDLYKLKNWTKYSVNNAKNIIAVSKTTKKDIIKFYNIQENKISVIYNGYEKKIKHNINNKKELLKSRFNINNPYIMHVGTLQPRKNIILLIKAFSEFKKRYEEYRLVLVGKKGWMFKDIFKQVKDMGLQNDIVFTGYISNRELQMLYQNAFCFVLPSFYEGFGIPILEAMSNNCPVISSFSSSLCEIGGNACLYFNPNDKNELVEKLNIMVKKPETRKVLINKGKERVKMFSWEKCSKETLELLKQSVWK